MSSVSQLTHKPCGCFRKSNPYNVSHVAEPYQKCYSDTLLLNMEVPCSWARKVAYTNFPPLQRDAATQEDELGPERVSRMGLLPRLHSNKKGISSCLQWEEGRERRAGKGGSSSCGVFFTARSLKKIVLIFQSLVSSRKQQSPLGICFYFYDLTG